VFLPGNLMEFPAKSSFVELLLDSFTSAFRTICSPVMTNVNPHHNKIPRVRAELGSATFPNWEKMEATAALN
jgi:hypothetical protein